MVKERYEMSDFEKGQNNTTKGDNSYNSPFFGRRHVQVLLYFLLVFIAYAIRTSLSVGIVAMTDPLASNNPAIPTYPHWDDKSIMLSSFFWGYIIPQIVAGWLASKYGAKWFLVATMGACSLFSVLLPTMAGSFGSKGVMASRAIQGFSQGFFFPSIHTLLSKWVPPDERSRLSSFVYAGGSLGSVVSMIITGIISASWYGWPMVFYVHGGIGLVWVLLMAILGANSPDDCPNISFEEKCFIENSLGQGENVGKKRVSTPWKEILTSLPVWAVLITHCGQNWGFWTLMTEIPIYLSYVMKFNIKSNSYLSALPYFVLWILSFLFSGLADMLIVRKMTTIGAARKIFNSVGLVIPAIALFALGMTTTVTTAVTLLIIAVGVNSAVYSGYNVNHLDLSPNHSGTLMGITNCVSNICSLMAPLVVQMVVTHEEDQSQWKIIFFLAASIYIASNAVFVLFGSGEVQSWNDSGAHDKDEQNK